MAEYKTDVELSTMGADSRMDTTPPVLAVVFLLVNRLVAHAFLGPPPSDDRFEVNHVDGNKSNNRANNLEYVIIPCARYVTLL